MTVDPAKVPAGTQLSGALVALDRRHPGRAHRARHHRRAGALRPHDHRDRLRRRARRRPTPCSTTPRPSWYDPISVDGETTMRLPEGEYSVMSYMDRRPRRRRVGDRARRRPRPRARPATPTVALDARAAKPVTVDVGDEGSRAVASAAWTSAPTASAGSYIDAGDERRDLGPADDGAERRLRLHDALAPAEADARPDGGQGAARHHRAGRVDVPRRQAQGRRGRRRQRAAPRSSPAAKVGRQGRRRDALGRGVGVASGRRTRSPRAPKLVDRRERRRRRVQRVGRLRGLRDRGRPPGRRRSAASKGARLLAVDGVEEGHDHRPWASRTRARSTTSPDSATARSPRTSHYHPKDLARIDTTYHGQRASSSASSVRLRPGAQYCVGLPMLRTERGITRAEWVNTDQVRVEPGRDAASTPMWEMRDMRRSLQARLSDVETSYFGGDRAPVRRPRLLGALPHRRLRAGQRSLVGRRRQPAAHGCVRHLPAGRRPRRSSPTSTSTASCGRRLPWQSATVFDLPDGDERVARA